MITANNLKLMSTNIPTAKKLETYKAISCSDSSWLWSHTVSLHFLEEEFR